MKIFFILVISLSFSLSAHGEDIFYCGAPSDKFTKEIFVTHVWRHTGISLHTSDLDPSLYGFKKLVGMMSYSSFGYGDEKIYRAEESEGMLTEALSLVLPRPAVLEVVGRSAIDTLFPKRIKVTESQLKSLQEFIGHTAIKDSEGEAIVVSRGVGGDWVGFPTAFYRAKEIPIPKSCNRWTMLALKAAGCEFSNEMLLTAKSLMDEVEKFPKVAITEGHGNPSNAGPSKR